MERISSRQNAIVKRFRDLTRASRGGSRAAGPDRAARDGHAPAVEVLLDGEHLVQEALACDVPVEIAAIVGTQLDSARSPLSRIAREVTKRGGRVVAVSDQVLAAMSPVQHPSGVVAIGHARPAALSATLSGTREAPLVAVLAGVQDPGNVGAIVRAAAGFGASGVVAVDGTAHPFAWKALRGAMGGTFRVPVVTHGELPEVIAAAEQAGVHVVAAVPRGGTPLPALDLRRPAAIVFGGEGAGVSAATLRAVRATVTIPMAAPVESLNVAVAAAVIFYEAMRQRRA